MDAYPWDSLYKTMLCLGLAPSEFWLMSPSEISLYFDAKRPQQQRGNMSESDLKNLTKRHAAGGDKYI